VNTNQKSISKGIKFMGGGLRIDGEANFSRRKTLREPRNSERGRIISRAAKPDTPKDRRSRELFSHRMGET
jgi:hypothetical protein